MYYNKHLVLRLLCASPPGPRGVHRGSPGSVQDTCPGRHGSIGSSDTCSRHNPLGNRSGATESRKAPRGGERLQHRMRIRARNATVPARVETNCLSPLEFAAIWAPRFLISRAPLPIWLQQSLAPAIPMPARVTPVPQMSSHPSPVEEWPSWESSKARPQVLAATSLSQSRAYRA